MTLSDCRRKKWLQLYNENNPPCTHIIGTAQNFEHTKQKYGALYCNHKPSSPALKRPIGCSYKYSNVQEYLQGKAMKMTNSSNIGLQCSRCFLLSTDKISDSKFSSIQLTSADCRLLHRWCLAGIFIPRKQQE